MLLLIFSLIPLLLLYKNCNKEKMLDGNILFVSLKFLVPCKIMQTRLPTKKGLLLSKRFRGAPSNFEILLGIFEVQNKILNGLETPVWHIIKIFRSSFKLIFINFMICFVNHLITSNLKNKFLRVSSAMFLL